MREWDPDEWIQRYEKRQRKKNRTRIPPKVLREVMEEPPKGGKGGLGPGEKEEEELWRK